MGGNRKHKQRMLRISVAAVLILIALLVERVGMHPPGIYSYTRVGYKAFQIGASKQVVLRQINLTRTIRRIKTCRPQTVMVKDSRKGLIMDEKLAAADTWICDDRTGKSYLFVFDRGILHRVLIQRLRFGEKSGSLLFSDCHVALPRDLDLYLDTQEKLKVFRETLKETQP